METDNETKEVMAENASVKNTIESPGWRVIENRFSDYINSLDSISNYIATDPELLVKEIIINKKVMETLKIFWNDIIGLADTAKDIDKILKDEENQEYLMYKD
jgi:hypothetical protein